MTGKGDETPKRLRRFLKVVVGIAVIAVAAVIWNYAGEVERQALTVRHGEVNAQRNVYPNNPDEAHGIKYQDVAIRSALGTFPAWQTDGNSDTWIILLHGKGEDRTELLRILPVFVESGYPTLTITYRNDPGVPASPTGYYQFGADEWQDLQAAATYAIQTGAQKLIIVGYSMGGAIALSFVYNSMLADRVVAIILDAPVLTFEGLLDHRAAKMKVPEPLTAAVKLVASLRFGLNYRTMDYIKPAAALAMPVLLIHGSEDQEVPIEQSKRLAEARPDIVTFVVFEGATHVTAWNYDREVYEDSVRDFLLSLK